jgi:hypothetical protein
VGVRDVDFAFDLELIVRANLVAFVSGGVEKQNNMFELHYVLI